jgi:hypothetical protein
VRAPFDPRELDRRVLPGAARRLRTAVDTADGVRRRSLAAVRLRWSDATTRGAAWARRTDERYASSGPLGVVRDVPQLALLVVAAVFLSGTAAAVWLTEPADEAGPTPRPGSVLRQAPLGPPPGAEVEQHLSQTRAVVESLAAQRPEATHLALVSLTGYVPAADVAQLVDGTGLQRVYLRPQGVEGAETVEVPLAGSASASVLPALCTATSTRKSADAEALRSLATSLEATTPEQELQRSDFESQAARAEAEAEAYAGACVTAFGVVVEGPARVLAQLLDRDGVRGVEVAPAGVSVLDLDVRPLLPEVSGRLPTGTER